MRKIAICNQKGGVAKTTTVVSLGGALAQNMQEVLLVDLDAQANLTLALGKQPARLRAAITDVLFDPMFLAIALMLPGFFSRSRITSSQI